MWAPSAPALRLASVFICTFRMVGWKPSSGPGPLPKHRTTARQTKRGLAAGGQALSAPHGHPRTVLRRPQPAQERGRSRSLTFSGESQNDQSLVGKWKGQRVPREAGSSQLHPQTSARMNTHVPRRRNGLTFIHHKSKATNHFHLSCNSSGKSSEF